MYLLNQFTVQYYINPNWDHLIISKQYVQYRKLRVNSCNCLIFFKDLTSLTFNLVKIIKGLEIKECKSKLDNIIHLSLVIG